MKHTHVGCYAILTHGERIALIRKSRGPYAGLLDLPGGTPDHGETPEQTVIREVMEELGIEVVRPVLLYVDTAVYDYRKDVESCQLHHLGLIYSCEANQFDLRSAGDGLDSLGAIWAETSNLDCKSHTPFVINAIKYLNIA